MLTSFLIGVAGSALVALLYGWFVAQREVQIRGYLLAKRDGWARRRSVRAFVGAVQGRAALVDTFMLLVLVLMIPTGICLTSVISAAGLQRSLDQLEVANERRQLSPDALSSSLKVTEHELRGVLARGRLAVLVEYAIGGLAFATVTYICWMSAPFALRQQSFAQEISRFTLRIQGLADSSELASLALTESLVSDEASLREFITVARAIAARNNVGYLVDRFDPWASRETERSSAHEAV